MALVIPHLDYTGWFNNFGFKKTEDVLMKPLIKRTTISSFIFPNELLWCLFNFSRGGSRVTATSKMEPFVMIVNGFRPLTIITKRSISDVAAALDPPLFRAIWCGAYFKVKQLHILREYFLKAFIKENEILTWKSLVDWSILSCVHSKWWGENN